MLGNIYESKSDLADNSRSGTRSPPRSFRRRHYGAEIAAIEAAQKKANDEDDRRQAYQKQAAIDHQSKLRLQIERNKVRRAEEKQAEFLEKPSRRSRRNMRHIVRTRAGGATSTARSSR